MKKLLKILLTIFISTLISSPISAQDSVIEITQSIKPSVVMVESSQFASKTTTKRYVKKGAGIFINSNGLIVTNFHTINGADQINLILDEGQTKRAKIVKVFPSEDLALLQTLIPYQSQPITVSNSNQLRLRQKIFHIGSSFILDGTISQGKITGLGTSQQAKQKGIYDIAIIQVNLDLYKGDSGGPLLNQKGHLIGMMVAKDIKKNKTSYAIPSNKIRNILYNF